MLFHLCQKWIKKCCLVKCLERDCEGLWGYIWVIWGSKYSASTWQVPFTYQNKPREDITLTHEANLNSSDEKLHIYFIILPTSFQIKYKKDLSKMKGAAHFHSLTAEDNLSLKQAQSVNKLVSEVRAWIDLLTSLGAAHTNICVWWVRTASKKKDVVLTALYITKIICV